MRASERARERERERRQSSKRISRSRQKEHVLEGERARLAKKTAVQERENSVLATNISPLARVDAAVRAEPAPNDRISSRVFVLETRIQGLESVSSLRFGNDRYVSLESRGTRARIVRALSIVIRVRQRRATLCCIKMQLGTASKYTAVGRGPPNARSRRRCLISRLVTRFRLQYPIWTIESSNSTRTCPVAFQNTLDRLPQTPSQPLSNPTFKSST